MRQHTAFENIYADQTRWAFHDTKDPLIRFVRDRRIQMGVDHAMRIARSSPETWDALVVCGGVGGEGTLLANLGFRSVAVSDHSENALAFRRQRDPRLQTRPLNAQKMDLPGGAYDLVLVQDGLHHLPRPVQGFTEMLRVARLGGA
jgi:ubiquinone/menaquinone biosynthesis C-methylase UbiE